jgi:hypothetical protein
MKARRLHAFAISIAAASVLAGAVVVPAQAQAPDDRSPYDWQVVAGRGRVKVTATAWPQPVEQNCDALSRLPSEPHSRVRGNMVVPPLESRSIVFSASPGNIWATATCRPGENVLHAMTEVTVLPPDPLKDAMDLGFIGAGSNSLVSDPTLICDPANCLVVN